jgi:hypothetical protein
MYFFFASFTLTPLFAVTHHILQSMSEHLLSKFGPIEAATAAGGISASGGPAAGVGARYGSTGMGGYGGGGGGGGVAAGGASGGNGMDPMTDAVFNAFKVEGGEQTGVDDFKRLVVVVHWTPILHSCRFG